VLRSQPLLERLLRALFALVCAAAAFGPLVGAGFHGDDLALLARASGLASQAAVPRPVDAAAALESEPRPLASIAPIEVMQILGDDASGDVGSLLSGWSVALSLRLWGTGETVLGLPAAFAYRLENLVFLVVAALGLWLFLWRIFRPWVGAEQAARASSTAAFLFVLHPLSVPSVAAIHGRADLMALAFGTFAAAAFLRGRQERDRRYARLSYVLCLLAGLCGQIALILPFGLALAEVFSSNRYRPLRMRLWTAFQTLLAFSAIVQLNTALVSYLTGHGYYAAVVVTLSRLGDVHGALRALALSIEKLGVLLLPANLSTLGLVGLCAAGLLGLIALQPALIAARTAPRLWGWALVSWLAAVAVSLLFGLHERVRLDQLATAATLLPATAAMCSGLGLASTALPGVRRLWVPILLALGFASLANGNAQPWAKGAERHADLAAIARERAPAGGVLLFVDAPRNVQGLDPIGSGLPWVLHPLFDRVSTTPAASHLADVPAEALGTLVRSPLWAPWRQRGLRVARTLAGGGLVFVDVPVARASTTPVTWLGASRSPELDVDPDALTALRLVAPEVPGGDVHLHFAGAFGVGDVPLPSWRGVAGARECWIDLSALPEWTLAGPVQRLWFEGGLSVVERAELVPALPRVDLVGEPERLPDGTWSFGTLAPDASAADDGAPRTFELRLLDLDTQETLVLALEPGRGGALRVAPPSDLVHRAREYGDHAFTFDLTLRVGGAALARTSGRLPDDFLE
jgi:hypothetical protein